MQNCYAYTRVSTVKQGDGASLEAQRDAITYYATKQNLNITKWFEEKETAAKKGRPIFNQVLKDLRRGKAAGLVIHKIDRSARNFADWAKIGDLADLGVTVHFATESLDFNSRGGRLSADIQAVIAADYIRNLREEAKKGLYMRLKQGIYPFKAPTGYLDTGKGNPKAIDPVKGPLIQTMFELYASEQYSLWSLPPEMERRGLTSFRGKPLTKSGIEKILKNPFYTGVIKINTTKKVFEGAHEPLIDHTLYERVQAVRAGRDNKKTTKHMHTYRGMFSCGYCERSLIPELQKGHVYYRCHTKGCATKCVTEQILEASLRRTLDNCVLPDAAISHLVEHAAKLVAQHEESPMKGEAKVQLATIESRLDRLTDKLLDEVIDQDTYVVKNEQLISEKVKWSSIAAQARMKVVCPTKLQKSLERLRDLCLHYQTADQVVRRQIAKLTTSNRIVHGKNVAVEAQEWLRQLHFTARASDGAHYAPTSRTNFELDTVEDLEQLYSHIEELLHEAASFEYENMH